MAITYRNQKGSPLNYSEVDENFRFIADLQNNGGALKGDLATPAPSKGADLVAFLADDPTDWNGGVSPALISDAADQLADRVKSVEGGANSAAQLRNDLADPALSGWIIAFKAALSSQLADAQQQTWTVQGKLQNSIDLFEDLTDAEITSVLLRTNAFDLSAKINAVLLRAKQYGKSVFAGAGLYPHAGQILVDGVTLHGEGRATEFRSTDAPASNPNHNIYLTGTNPKLIDVKTSTTWSGSRQVNTNSQAVSIVNATSAEVAGVYVFGSASAGILGQSSTDTSIHHCRVENTLADGIHNTNASYDVSVYANKLVDTGDDAIAFVAYNLGGFAQSARGQCWGNIIRGGSGRGVSIIGWAEVQAFGNYAFGTAGAGFSVSSESAYTSYAATDCMMNDNTAIGCATSGTLNHPQYFLYTQGAVVTQRCHFINNKAYGSPTRSAFRAQGGSIGCSANGMQIDGTGKVSVLNGSCTNLIIQNTTARNLADGVFEITGASGDVVVKGLTGLNCFGTPSLNRVVNLNVVSGITSLTLNDLDVDTAGLTQVYGGDSTSTALRPNIVAMRNSSARVPMPDVLGIGALSGTTRQIVLSQRSNYIKRAYSELSANPVAISFISTRHQAIEVKLKSVADGGGATNATQYQFLRQRWIYGNAAGVGTSGVDYVDTGGGFRYQRTDIENFNGGALGTWAMVLSGSTVTATYTPPVLSHIQIEIEAVYKSA